MIRLSSRAVAQHIIFHSQPAIDRTIVVPSLILGNVHRAEQVIVAAGGKGLNLARAMRTLGGEALSMGFAGGHSERLLADLAQNEGLKSAWTRIDSETRTGTILVSQNGDATLINEPGMPVTKSDWKRLKRDVGKYISSASLCCVSGSLPPRLPWMICRGDYYVFWLTQLKKSGWIRVVLH